jgi:hypothetical protein
MIISTYSKVKPKIMSGSINFATANIYLALLKDTYTPDVDDEFWSDISTHEITAGDGYAAGGKILGSQAVTEDETNEEAMVDGDDFLWAAFTGTFQYLVLYKNTGVAGTSPLIGYYDLEANEVVTAQPYLVTLNTLGLMRLL